MSARFILAYSITRNHWIVDDTQTGKRRTFATRDKAIAALDKANAGLTR